MTDRWPKLRDLGVCGRLGVAGVVLTMLIGFAASLAYIKMHHAPRDGEPGLSMTDIKGAYHGVDSQSSLLRALKDGHPEEMPEQDRVALIAWLESPRIAEDYDSLELGDLAPAELIADNCLSCHSRRVADEHPIARTVPLDYWDDVSRIAFSRRIDPPPIEILTVSTHTHALSLGALTAVTAGLLLATCWPRRLVGALIFLSGVALFADIGAWWLARAHEQFVYVIVAAGGAYSGAMIVSLLAILVDLCLPAPRKAGRNS